MNKPEPLKDKGFTIKQIFEFITKRLDEANIGYSFTKEQMKLYGKSCNERAFGNEDIKSAVEWLKSELNKAFGDIKPKIGRASWFDFSKKIDEAFEDVMKIKNDKEN